MNYYIRTSNINFGEEMDMIQPITWVFGITGWKAFAFLSFYFTFYFFPPKCIQPVFWKQVHFFLKHPSGASPHGNIKILSIIVRIKKKKDSKDLTFFYFLKLDSFVTSCLAQILEKLQPQNENLAQGNCWKVCVLRKVFCVLCFQKSIKQFTPFTFHGKSVPLYKIISNDLPHQKMEVNS